MNHLQQLCNMKISTLITEQLINHYDNKATVHPDENTLFILLVLTDFSSLTF